VGRTARATARPPVAILGYSNINQLGLAPWHFQSTHPKKINVGLHFEPVAVK
jgi:hypothetical protein